MTLTIEQITEVVEKALKGQGEKVPASFMNLYKREGEDTLQTSLKLYSENFELRETRRKLQEEVDELKKSSDVPEDQTLISKDDAELLTKYKELGTPDEIGKVTTDFTTMQRSQVLAKVAETAGYEPSVFNRLAGDLTFEEKDETIDGETKKYIVVLPGEGKEAIRIDEYAKTNWENFLPALKPEGDGGNTQAQSTTQGTEFVKQKGKGDSTKPKSVLEAHLERREERNKTKGSLDKKE